MKKLNELSLPVTIIIASFILGGFYYAGELSKQKTIERQQEVKTEEDRRARESKLEQVHQNELSLQFCLDDSDAKYKKSVQYWLNLEKQVGADNVLKSVEKEKTVLQQDKDECYKRYK